MSQSPRIRQIHDRLSPLRSQLIEHSLYQRIDSLAALHLFMQHHIFAVWDFMSLLKFLQQKLCCVQVPWIPPQDRANCRLINEIVLGEESDDDGRGGAASHYDLYHSAMQQCGAATVCMDRFLAALTAGQDVAAALRQANAPQPVHDFVTQTFDTLAGGNVCAIASAFAFGREQLLPDVFRQIVATLNARNEGRLDEFLYYLNRHIELDGDEHGPMTERLIEQLCQDDEAQWAAAEEAAASSLQSRLNLWDGICASLVETAAAAPSSVT